MPDWRSVLPAMANAGIPVEAAATPKSIGGGDISDAWRLDTSGTTLFLKTGPSDAAAMFSAEADGLGEIAASGTVRVPGVFGHGSAGPVAWIALEWLDLGPASEASQRRLGRQLAAMHRVAAERHGWTRNNTIGSTPQVNDRTADWASFWRDHRLGFQLRLAARYGYTGRIQDLGAEVMDRIDEILGDHEPVPSLLHGDLWGGNQAAVGDEPVLFDPAVYFGDRETDLAMTRLFGGFSGTFYEEYRRVWPLPPGHEDRLPMYQLYHVLNHLNLFGRGYLGRAEQLLESIIATAGRRDSVRRR